MTTNRSGHIRLTSHPGAGTPSRFPIRWGAPTARERGPVVGTVTGGVRGTRLVARVTLTMVPVAGRLAVIRRETE